MSSLSVTELIERPAAILYTLCFTIVRTERDGKPGETRSALLETFSMEKEGSP